MNKTVVFLAFLLLLATNLHSQNKSKFDLTLPDIKSNLSLTMGAENLRLTNEATDITLLKEGYFTIGTNKGKSSGTLDDSCQITFGHPYAMTSYPYFRINGVTKNPDVYFYGQTMNLVKLYDTLKLTADEDSKIGFIFYLTTRDSGNTIRVEVKIINKDNIANNLSAGVVFDPALGKWGDGFIFDNGVPIPNNKTYQTGIPQNFEIWERGSAPKGLGLLLNFPASLPDRVDINNWFSLYNNQPENQSQLYDLALNIEKTNASVAPGDTLTLTFDIMLQQPEFPDGLFIRSQIPTFFSIENDILFPSEGIAMSEIYNNSSNTFQNVKLKLQGGQYIDDYESPASFQLNSGAKAYKNIHLVSHEIYENIVTPLKLDVTNNDQLQDELLRNLFIPTSPFSDTGLVVDIDSINIKFPHVSFRFQATRQDNGGLLTNLRKENLFLYEDQQRISNLTLAKDTTGGADQADIVFVLDVTGSMGGEIDFVKNNIVEFTDSLSRRGINFRLGMVTFLDAIENVYDFTSDVQLFQQHIGQQYAHSGDDRPENSLAALMRASQFDFRPSAKRIFIWITDADYHIQDQFTNLVVQDVVNALLSKSIVANCIGDLQFQTDYYDPIVLPTGGNVYNINGNFRDILLDISRLKSSGKYWINYTSTAAAGSHQVKLELHYGGLGGNKTFNYNLGLEKAISNETEGVVCYPNPFNPSTNIYVKNPGMYSGEALIYNLLGQKVKTFRFESGQNPILLRWSAQNDFQQLLSTGIYFVQVKYYIPGKDVRSLPIQKLVYIK